MMMMMMMRRRRRRSRQWCVLMDMTTDTIQDSYNEMIESTLKENPDKDLHEAEMIAYDE